MQCLDRSSLVLPTGLKNVQATPRILFLEPQPCIRALKYAKGLKWAFGGKIDIIFAYLYRTLNELYGHGDEVFDRLVKLNPDNLEGDIKRLVNKFDPLVIHSHNAPDFLTISAIEAVNREVPVIHDGHEALTLRETGYYASDDEETIRNKYPRQEKIANERSDGRIYVTEGVRDYIQERYDVDRSKDMVFYSYVCQSMVPSRLRRKLSDKDGQTHIVYIGTVTSIVKDSHYDLRETFREIAKQRIHVHMYVTIWGTKDKAYHRLAEENNFIHYHGHLDQKALLYEITQYDFGWAGFNVNPKNRKHLDVALPNKVFEYIACGLPVLAFPHRNISGFLNRHKVGLVFDSVDEMASQLQNGKLESVKKNVLNARYEFTVEKNISKLTQYYEETRGSNASTAIGR
jgi:glycosyltransferase involved in cell wall biosynthesis